MLVPSIFGEDLFDDFMRFPAMREPHRPSADEWRKVLMKTDIREVDGNYELAVDLPGFDKEQMKLHLKDGYLTIEASRTDDKDTKDENGKYLRRERYAGSCSRTFFVGKDLTHEDIHAKYDNGVLKITFPKEVKREVEEKKYISIEG
ncbi:MAG: Hsp20/alpha crystallin family protein [Blautia sp.]|nr:Hsp20/alpha crystallin family protein [Blautia sp.]